MRRSLAAVVVVASLIGLAPAGALAASPPAIPPAGAEPARTVQPPDLSMTFLSSTVRVGSSVSLGFVIENPMDNSIALTGVGFTLGLPDGLRVMSSTATVCTGIRTTTKPSGISLSGATIAVGSRCKFSVSVTGWTPGTKTATVANVVSNETAPGSSASAVINVWTPPTIELSFNHASMALGDSVWLLTTVDNPPQNHVAISDIELTYTLPAGLRVVGTPPSPCSGHLALTATGFNVTDASVPIDTSCAYQVTVESSASGTLTASVVGTLGGGGFSGNSATARIVVVPPPTPPTPTPRPRPAAVPTAPGPSPSAAEEGISSAGSEESSAPSAPAESTTATDAAAPAAAPAAAGATGTTVAGGLPAGSMGAAQSGPELAPATFAVAVAALFGLIALAFLVVLLRRRRARRPKLGAAG